MAMNKIFLIAGITIIIGLIIIVIAEALAFAGTDRYWDAYETGTIEEFIDAGRTMETYGLIWDIGFMICLIGIAFIAIGLAIREPHFIVQPERKDMPQSQDVPPKF